MISYFKITFIAVSVLEATVYLVKLSKMPTSFSGFVYCYIERERFEVLKYFKMFWLANPRFLR